MMQEHTQIIFIGSTKKHLGKTSLVCELITRLKQDGRSVTAIKATPDEERLFIHKAQEADLTDTGRMLSAGADQAIHVVSTQEFFCQSLGGVIELDRIKGVDHIIVETTSGRGCFEPDLFIMLKGDDDDIKESAKEYISLADHVIEMHEGLSFGDIISIREGRIVISTG